SPDLLVFPYTTLFRSRSRHRRQDAHVAFDERVGRTRTDPGDDGSVLQDEMGSGNRIPRPETNAGPREAALPQQQATVGRTQLVDHGDGSCRIVGPEGAIGDS